MPIRTALIAMSAAALATPVAAQDASDTPAPIVEPAVQAEWTNTAKVQRTFVRETKGFSRFETRPAMKIGLMVEADGTVSECLPLAITDGAPAYGKELCPAIEQHAAFAPARDAEGNAVRSVYIVRFEAYSPGSAAENRDLSG